MKKGGISAFFHGQIGKLQSRKNMVVERWFSACSESCRAFMLSTRALSVERGSDKRVVCARVFFG